MTDTEPSQPLTDADERVLNRDLLWAPGTDAITESQMSAIRTRHSSAAQPIPSKTALGYDHLMAHADRAALLAEVDRIRSENAAIKTERDQFRKMMNSTVSAGVTIDGERLDALRERDALRAQLDAARKALFDDAFEGHAQRYRALARALGGTDA